MAAGGGNTAPQLPDMDALLEEVHARKGPRKYTEGLSEDNWEEELEQIPLFMTRPPEAVNSDLSPALAALQDIKYQEEMPLGRALLQKEEGNDLFKRRRYKEAIAAYSAGVRDAGADVSVHAVLLSNRAAAHSHLGNHRSALADATQAKQVKPDHVKAIVRGATSCIALGRHGDAIEWCDEGLRIEPDNGKLRELRSQASQGKKQKEREERRGAVRERAQAAEEKRLREAIKSRGVRLHGDDAVSLDSVHPSGGRVHLDRGASLDGGASLIWPVLFLYPEHGQTDLINDFNEKHTFSQHIEVMFGLGAGHPGWDSAHLYVPGRLEVYYEAGGGRELVPVPLSACLADTIAQESYEVVCGTPSFILLVAGTAFREHFIAKYKIP